MLSLNTFELKCHSADGSAIEYYYFSCRHSPRNPKSALNSGYAPDKMRIVCNNHNVEPFEIRLIWPWKYIMKKYIINWFDGFANGYRVNWEKEFKKSVDN